MGEGVRRRIRLIEALGTDEVAFLRVISCRNAIRRLIIQLDFQDSETKDMIEDTPWIWTSQVIGTARL